MKMIVTDLIFLTGGIWAFKEILKHIVLKPRRDFEYYKNDVPFKELLVSSVLAKLAYHNPKDFAITHDSILESDRELDKFLKQHVLPKNAHHAYFYDCGSVGTQAYMWKSKGRENTIYVVFRGTEETKDVLEDLDCRRYEFEGNARIHCGFKNQFDAIKKKLGNDLLEELASGGPLGGVKSNVYFIGHSLGGALATLATLYFHRILKAEQLSKQITVHCHTFGSPRVGDCGFVNLFSKKVDCSKVWRVHNYEDPVSMIPFTCRFQHIKANSLCLGDGSKMHLYKNDTHSILRPLYNIAMINIFRPIYPHNCDVYIKKLERICHASKRIIF